ncbi:hypothetical protein [Blastococcus sp. TF02-09]|uniref:hypothetical protein n=1 Tax=Blastococcus sp. TF02-09 TaxID=2250576 RepID=UPI0018F2A517|nr:hypothetical protein [Blastococcus sp. TF02-9]
MTSIRTAPATSPRPRAGGLLRLALGLDAVVTGVNGAAYLLGAALLDGPLGLSPGLLRGVGVVLLGYAAAVWFVRPVARSPAPRSRRSWAPTCCGPSAASSPPSSASAR